MSYRSDNRPDCPGQAGGMPYEMVLSNLLLRVDLRVILGVCC